jgi:hypothetical protein
VESGGCGKREKDLKRRSGRKTRSERERQSL